MEIFDVDKKQYESAVRNVKYIYDSVWFHEINGNKVEKVCYFLFKNSKNKCGMIVGIRDQTAWLPYSAPFGMVERINLMNLEEMDEVIFLLEKYLSEIGVKKIFFRLPPFFYDETFISELQNILTGHHFVLTSVDLNYQFFLKDETYYFEHLQRNAKKNLQRALKSNWSFHHCDDWEDKKLAYDIIAENRKSKGYPLKMSWEAIRDTCAHISSDFFLLELENSPIAAAIVFGVTTNIAQVIYWGDMPNSGLCRSMNYLAYQIYRYYLNTGIEVLDIGPSTENGIPNFGLCNFKRSIGCDVSSKLTFEKEFE